MGPYFPLLNSGYKDFAFYLTEFDSFFLISKFWYLSKFEEKGAGVGDFTEDTEDDDTDVDTEDVDDEEDIRCFGVGRFDSKNLKIKISLWFFMQTFSFFENWKPLEI